MHLTRKPKISQLLINWAPQSFKHHCDIFCRGIKSCTIRKLGIDLNPTRLKLHVSNVYRKDFKRMVWSDWYSCYDFKIHAVIETFIFYRLANRLSDLFWGFIFDRFRACIYNDLNIWISNTNRNYRFTLVAPIIFESSKTLIASLDFFLFGFWNILPNGIKVNPLVHV